MNAAATASARIALPAARARALWTGIALAAAIAAAGTWAAGTTWARSLGLSALTLSIVFGMVVGNTVFPAVEPVAAAGVDFSKNRLLRAGVVLYGLRITFGQLAQIGWAGIVIDVVMVSLTYTVALQLGTRLFRLDRDTSMLIGVGAAICGAAAVLAAEPVVRAPAHKVTVAVATVVVFGTLGLFLYPLLYPHLALSPHAYGVFAGSTIHEVAQVVAAGRAVSESAASAAVIEKMLRVMLLAPFLMVLSYARPSREDGAAGGRVPVVVPWFAVLFVAACGLNSLGVLPRQLIAALTNLDTLLLATAMSALGLRTHARAIRDAGLRPLLLAGSVFCFLLVGGYAVNRVLTLLLG